MGTLRAGAPRPSVDYSMSEAQDFNKPPLSDPELPAGYGRPVMIHRAVLGSFERMIGILTEHFAGKWPFWVSPRQVIVVPVTASVYDYASEVKDRLWSMGFYSEVDLGPDTLPKKIRNAEIAQWNFIFVVGAEERDSASVNLRNRDDQASQQRGEVIPLQEAIDKLVSLRDERRLENTLV